MKRILIFSTAYLPLIGGAEIAVKEITDRLGDFSAQDGPASGWEIDLICARIKKELPKRESVGKVNVYRAGWGWGKIDKFLLPWRGAALAAKLHAEKKYDLIWAIMASFGGLAALRFKLKHPVLPYLLTLQEGDSAEHIASRARWLGPYYKKIFAAADFITAISQYLKDFALTQGARSQIEIVPNGVDINKFSIFPFRQSDSEASNFPPYGWSPEGRQFSKKELKEKLGIKEDEEVIITVSRLVAKNGINDLIDAINLSLITYHLSLKLLVLGAGSLEKGLRLKVKSLRLENSILFLGDVPNDKVPQYLAIADVFVRPSLAEGLGSAFLEAMAAGVPIIGTPVGGIPDFLRDGETGLFCEVKNSPSIAGKIYLLLADEALRQKLIANGRQLVSEKYGWDKIAKQMETIFEKLKIGS